MRRAVYVGGFEPGFVKKIFPNRARPMDCLVLRQKKEKKIKFYGMSEFMSSNACLFLYVLIISSFGGWLNIGRRVIRGYSSCIIK